MEILGDGREGSGLQFQPRYGDRPGLGRQSLEIRPGLTYLVGVFGEGGGQNEKQGWKAR